MSGSWTASADISCCDCGTLIAVGEIHYPWVCLSRVIAERDGLRGRIKDAEEMRDANARGCDRFAAQRDAATLRAEAAEGREAALREALIRLDALYRDGQDFGELPPGSDGRPDWLSAALAQTPAALVAVREAERAVEKAARDWSVDQTDLARPEREALDDLHKALIALDAARKAACARRPRCRDDRDPPLVSDWIDASPALDATPPLPSGGVA